MGSSINMNIDVPKNARVKSPGLDHLFSRQEVARYRQKSNRVPMVRAVAVAVAFSMNLPDD